MSEEALLWKALQLALQNNQITLHEYAKTAERLELEHGRGSYSDRGINVDYYPERGIF